MKRSVWFWVLAFILTIVSLAYQRRTGPTYPVRGDVEIDGVRVEYVFERAHPGEGAQEVRVTAGDSDITGNLFWKRHNTEDQWTVVPMKRAATDLIADLPHQPPAGKLQYYVVLEKDADKVNLPEKWPIIIRFRGDVPLWVILPHVLFIFLSMLLAIRAGMQALVTEQNLFKYTVLVVVTMFLGGMIFGPIMQKYAFGAFWTGVPFGIDLTDNKTLIAMIFWFIALFKGRKGKNNRIWVIIAALVTIVIFIIPHSVLGSELDYSKMPAEN